MAIISVEHKHSTNQHTNKHASATRPTTMSSQPSSPTSSAAVGPSAELPENVFPLSYTHPNCTSLNNYDASKMFSQPKSLPISTTNNNSLFLHNVLAKEMSSSLKEGEVKGDEVTQLESKNNNLDKSNLNFSISNILNKESSLMSNFQDNLLSGNTCLCHLPWFLV